MRSRDQGIQAFDFTVTEVQRGDRTSVLRIPGFHKRSAQASRWMMCVYTHVALTRGFQYWATVYPTAPDEDVLVAFPASDKEDLAQLLGEKYKADQALISPVDKMAVMCGMRKPPGQQ
jgi:hypothetical protein